MTILQDVRISLPIDMYSDAVYNSVIRTLCAALSIVVAVSECEAVVVNGLLWDG